MKTLDYCRHFYQHYFTKYDRILFLLVFINTLISCIHILTNVLTNNYSGTSFVHVYHFMILPPTLALVFLSMYLRQHSPNIALVNHTYGFLFTMICSFAISDTAIQLTPFHPIDQHLVSFDQFFGVNTVSLLQWTHLHPLTQQWLNFCYFSLMPELLFTPLIISLLRERQTCRIYLISALIGYMLIQNMYYFFPTVAPAGIFHSHLFLSDQYNCTIRFYKIHHHLPVSINSATCLIAFPSPHVFCACLIWYAYKNNTWLFIPIGIINLSMIAATVLLGYHYFADVLAGISVACLSITVTHSIDKRVCQDPLTYNQLHAQSKKSCLI